MIIGTAIDLNFEVFKQDDFTYYYQVGLAVGNTEGELKKATLTRLALQVHMQLRQAIQ